MLRKPLLIALTSLLSLGLSLAGLLTLWMPSQSYSSTPPPLTAAEQTLKVQLTQTLQTLETIGPRNAQNPNSLEKTIAFLAPQLPERQEYSYAIGSNSNRNPTTPANTYENRIAEIKGKEHPEQIIVIGAHYDTVPGSPGADDDGTGIAALLALKDRFAQAKPARTLRFIAFANEEQPFSGTDGMGSLIAARQARSNPDQILGMLSLEMLGYYDDRPNSQRYPIPVNGLYPDRGNFIGFVSNLKSRELLKTSLLIFRKTATLPSEGLALPEAIPDIGRSDHASFWKYDYPAIMITDTANFRSPFYHQPQDTLKTLDLDRLTRAVVGIEQIIAILSGAHLE